MGDEGSKLSVFSEWFTGDHVLLHLDSRKSGVFVPSHLSDNHSLTLKVSRLFQGRTDYNEVQVSAFLRFEGDYFECVIPWDAVWGMTSANSEQRIWTEDLPTEVISQLALSKLKEIGARILGKGKKEEKKEGKEKEEKEEDEKLPKDETKRKTPTLRRIK